jgi:hypothetical protein
MKYQKPKRTFEDSGSVNPEQSYYVPLENVTNTKKQDIKTMVDLGRYFSIFAPRQSGKTTVFKRICSELQKDPTYVAIVLSLEDYTNVDKIEFYSLLEMELYEQLLNRLNEVNCKKVEDVNQFLQSHHLTGHLSFRVLFEKLNRIIQQKKIVVFIDEFDGIPGDELENFLTTLRKLYQKYKEVKQKALYSIGLIGIRNITKLIVGGVSPFNIADQVKEKGPVKKTHYPITPTNCERSKLSSVLSARQIIFLLPWFGKLGRTPVEKSMNMYYN